MSGEGFVALIALPADWRGVTSLDCHFRRVVFHRGAKNLLGVV